MIYFVHLDSLQETLDDLKLLTTELYNMDPLEPWTLFFHFSKMDWYNLPYIQLGIKLLLSIDYILYNNIRDKIDKQNINNEETYPEIVQDILSDVLKQIKKDRRKTYYNAYLLRLKKIDTLFDFEEDSDDDGDNYDNVNENDNMDTNELRQRK
jgi:hypothetical protein